MDGGETHSVAISAEDASFTTRVAKKHASLSIPEFHIEIYTVIAKKRTH